MYLSLSLYIYIYIYDNDNSNDNIANRPWWKGVPKRLRVPVALRH